MAIIPLVINNIIVFIATPILSKQGILLCIAPVLIVPPLNFLQHLLLRKHQSVLFLALQPSIVPPFLGTIVFLVNTQTFLPKFIRPLFLQERVKWMRYGHFYIKKKKKKITDPLEYGDLWT